MVTAPTNPQTAILCLGESLLVLFSNTTFSGLSQYFLSMAPVSSTDPSTVHERQIWPESSAGLGTETEGSFLNIEKAVTHKSFYLSDTSLSTFKVDN